MFKNINSVAMGAAKSFGTCCVKAAKSTFSAVSHLASTRSGALALALCLCFVLAMLPADVFAQNSSGDYSAGTTALGTVTTEIIKYVPVVQKLCYAIAGVVAIVGAISVYIAMNNGVFEVV